MAKYVKSTVTLNMARIRQLDAAAQMALFQTTEVLHTEVDQAQVVPRDSGDLQKSGFVDDSDLKSGKMHLVYSTPYARRMYFHPEYKFQTTENPNAQGLWLKDYKSGGSKEKYVIDTFRKLYKRLAGV